MPERQTNETLQRQEQILSKIQGQFDRLDTELDSLEATMRSAGWLAELQNDDTTTLPRKPRKPR